MTAEDKYTENQKDFEDPKEYTRLGELAKTVRSIDDHVDDILDLLKEHVSASEENYHQWNNGDYGYADYFNDNDCM